MALSKKALQNKREKKKKKRQGKILQHNTSSNISYNHWPVYECYIKEDLWVNGIGEIVISRKNNFDEFVVGIYLVDVFCLGVKNCFVRPCFFQDYNYMLEQMRSSGNLQVIDATYAATLITKAVEYADQFSFKPHQDFHKAKKLLQNIPIDEQLAFCFGKDGKPFYIQGPHESPSDVRRIMKALETHAREGNYHYRLEVSREEAEEAMFIE